MGDGRGPDRIDGENPDADARHDTDSARNGTDGSRHGGVGDDSDPVEVGVELLSKLEFGSLSVADAVDRIETVTSHPGTTREILDEAEARGVVEREDGEVYPQGGGYVSFQSEVVTKEGEFSCRRCGSTLSTGYFVRLDAGELGPFGSSCIRKVTGRE